MHAKQFIYRLLRDLAHHVGASQVSCFSFAPGRVLLNSLRGTVGTCADTLDIGSHVLFLISKFLHSTRINARSRLVRSSVGDFPDVISLVFQVLE